MKEFKVKLKYHENDDYNELWLVINGMKANQYFARNTYGWTGMWYFVSDPLGYCELDHPCPNDYIFIVCDQKGNELFRSCNGDDSCNFPCLRAMEIDEWNKFIEASKQNITSFSRDSDFFAHWATGMTSDGCDRWLLTFKDPEIYGDVAKDYDENWCWHYTEVGEPEILATFNYAGTDYHITRQRYKHNNCGVEWDNYYSGQHYKGSVFDSNNVGTMYSAREATEKVVAALKEIYPNCKYTISAVDEYPAYGRGEKYYSERKMKFWTAAERLLGRNYNRIFVDSVIENERNNPSMYADYKEIKAKYPDCEMDFKILY